MKNNSNDIKGQTRVNMAMSVVYQITAAVCSLILPRYILLHFGSDVNGMMQSINQLFSYTALMECGIGGLITASLYKPLANGDTEAVSDIFNNSKRFFDRISIVFALLVVMIAGLSKLIIKTNFDFVYVCTMSLILGVNYYFNYYFALTQRLLLRADQKLRIIYASQSITLILNAVICIAAMKLGAGIHMVKFVSALVYLINPAVYRLYVRKHYSISRNVYDKGRILPRKSDAVIHHLAFFIHMNTDIVLISAFTGTKEVSVYSVYNSIIYVIESFFTTISESVSSAFGNFIAKEEKGKLEASFEMYQAVNIAAATFVCIVEAVLIVPFVEVYTSGVTDVNYIRPAFAYVMILAQWFFCVRMPYSNTINAAGHYKQTKMGAYMEALLNVVISVVALKHFGLFGVAFGTAVGMCARSIYMAWYLSKNIVCRKMILFVKEIIFNACFGGLLVWGINNVIKLHFANLFEWAVCAAVVCIITCIAILLFNLLVNRKTFVALVKFFKKK